MTDASTATENASPNGSSRNEANDRYQALIRATGSIVWRTDAEGQLYDAPEWCAATGQTSEESEGMGWASAVHPNDREAVVEEWRRCIATSQPFDATYRLRLASGDYRWHRDRGVPVFEAGGRVREWVGVCEDVHERRLLDEALVRENSRYATILQFEQEVASIGGDYREVASAVLRGAAALLGADGACLEMAVGDELVFEVAVGSISAFQGLRISSVGSLAGNCIAQRKIAISSDAFADPRVDAAVVRRLGIRSMLVVPLVYGEQGIGALKLISVRPDVFEADHIRTFELLSGFLGATIGRARAEEALRESEDHYRFMVDATPLVTWTADSTGSITDFSEKWASLTGLPREAALGQGWARVVHPDDLPTTAIEWTEAVRTGRNHDIVHRIRTEGGAYRWVRTRAIARRDASGAIVRWYGSSEDIHAHKSAAIELEELVSERTKELAHQLATTAAIANNADSALLLLDADGKITQANPAFFRLTGYTETEAIRATSHDLLHSRRLDGGHYSANDCPIYQSIVQGEPLHRHADMYHGKDGRPFPVVVSFTPIHQENGEVSGGVLEFRDVTAEREAERELRRREERYRFLSEAIPLPLWTCDPKGRVTYVNDRWRSNYGIDPDSPREDRWSKHVHPDDRDRVRAEWSHCLETRQPFFTRCRLRVAREGFRWHYSVATPEMVEGEVLEWIGANFDVHDQTEHERALELTNRVGRILSEDLDLERIVQALTDASVEATGAEYGAFFSRQEGVEDFSLFALSGAPREAFSSMSTIRATELLGPTFRGERVVRSDDVTQDPLYGASGPERGMPHGHIPVRSYLAVPVISRAGEGFGALLLGHQEPAKFTEEHERLVFTFAAQAAIAIDNARLYERQAKTNEELVIARDQALAASRAKSEFLANMSHEIRTPLNGVLGMASLLEDLELDLDAREMVDTISSSGETLLRVIDEVLDLAKIEAGRMEIERASADLANLVQDVVALYRGHALSKRIDLSARLPESPAPLVLADPLRLRQVLSNLVSNAVKFTEQGRVEVALDWEREPAGIAVRLTVKDTGVGIPEDRLERIFDSFSQADGSIQRRYGGTGLGLTIAQKIVSLMDGRLSVVSRAGVGTTFTVNLILEPGRASMSVEGTETEEIDLGLRVLVAEDNKVNVLVVRRLLERCGCQVDVAEDGLRAIAMTSSRSYDLVLMDLQMPYCDGLEATRRIRETEAREGRPRLSIVALTANAMESDRLASAAAGMDGFIAKPISLEAVRGLLGALQSKHRGSRRA